MTDDGIEHFRQKQGGASSGRNSETRTEWNCIKMGRCSRQSNQVGKVQLGGKKSRRVDETASRDVQIRKPPPAALALFAKSKSASGGRRQIRQEHTHSLSLTHTTAIMAPSFDNLDNDENFDDVDIDFSGMLTGWWMNAERHELD
jgi:hypothetical protein